MIRFEPIDSILVEPHRQRKQFPEEAHRDLVESIENGPAGLMHPLLCVRDERGLTLVAGERRLRAIREIYSLDGTFRCGGAPVEPGMVPYLDLGEMTQLEAWETQLRENIDREDLTFLERASATAEWMEMRRQQAAEKGEPAPSASEVAVELRPDATPEHASNSVKMELVVARHADDPDVQKASSLKEAYKVLKKKEEGRRNEERAQQVGKNFTAADHELVNGDSKEKIAELGQASFDIILTDPPYGIGADAFGDSGKGVRAQAHFYEDTLNNWRDLVNWFSRESFRVAKPNAHLYAFCDLDNFAEFRWVMKEAGWKVHRTPLVWYNPDGFRAPWPEQGPQRKYELILYAVKGEKKVASVRGDVLEYRKDSAEGHPAQKPVNLLIDLLKRSSVPGDRVLDPFAGSGSTVVACHELKLACTAIEMDAGAYGIAVKRLKELK